MSKVLDIEQSFQNWLSTTKENYAYVLCAPECAARYAFEAGINEARNESKAAANNTGSPKLLSQLGIVEVLLLQEDYGAARANVVALIAQLRAGA